MWNVRESERQFRAILAADIRMSQRKRFPRLTATRHCTYDDPVQTMMRGMKIRTQLPGEDGFIMLCRCCMRILLCLALPVISGCSAPGISFSMPDINLPSSYQQADAVPAPANVISDDTLIDWWRYFGNNELERLIDRGLSNNPDMHIALSRVVQAKARADQAAAGLNPGVSAPLVVAMQYPGDVTVGTAPTGTSSNGSSQSAFQASIRADWRLDIWGEQKALAESANFQMRRAVFERENVQRNMAASLAASYVEFLSLNDRLRTALENEEVLNATLAAIEKRVKSGDATLSELEQQRAVVYSVRATIPSLEQQRLDAIGSMAFLVGTVPGNINLSDHGLDSLSVPRAVPSLPSSLLLRRPDVRMAEAQLLMADADVAVARARLLPPVDLSAQVGYSSISLSQLLQPKTLFWNVVESMTVSIFDSGRKKNEQIYSQAVQGEMVESYVRTIHQAMKEVESALASVRLAERRLKAQQDTIAAARRAWNISAEVYTMGGIDYMSLLDTQRNYHRYLDEYQKSRMDYFRSYVSLFQALGGGVRPIRAEAAGLVGIVPVKTVEGISMDEGSAASTERFWQVELASLYHRSTIGPAWRDLLSRYPRFMEGRVVRPRLSGKIEDTRGGSQSWHRLYVAKFPTPEEAEEFCQALKADQQRCRVVSSQSDETVVVSLPSRAGAAAQSAVAAPSEAQIALTSPQPATAVATPVLRPGATLDSAAPREQVAYSVQLGNFFSRENAILSREFWISKGYDAFISESLDDGSRPRYAVRTGVYSQKKDAARAARAIRITEEDPAVPVPILVNAAGQPEKLDLVANAVAVQTTPVIEPPEVLSTTLAEIGAPAVAPNLGPEMAFAVQLGAFASAENAAVSMRFWRGKGYPARQVEITDAAGRHWYAVRTGTYALKSEAEVAALAFGRKEGALALVAHGHAEIAVATPLVATGSSPAMTKAPAVATPAPPTYAVQVGAFANADLAYRAAAALQEKGVSAYVARLGTSTRQSLYAVRVGRFTQRSDGLTMLASLKPKDRSRAKLVEIGVAPSVQATGHAVP